MGMLLAAIEAEDLSENQRQILEDGPGGRTVLLSTDPKEMEEHLDAIEVALGNVPRGLLARMPRLVWYQQLGTGTEWLAKWPETIEHPFILTNCSDDYGVVLAEHIMALILATARQLPVHLAAQQRSEWGRQPFSDRTKFELRGKTLLLVGVGSIGCEIARRARGFSMRIYGLRSDPTRGVEGIDQMYGPQQLKDALSEADLIVNSLPLTPKTRGFFDRDAFAAMKPGACFFNIGRGQTVDEAALTAALTDGRLAGAGLDVFSEEPLPQASPLWKLPNVIITPHDGGNHDRRYASWLDTVFDNLNRFHQGLPLRNRVDKSRQY